MNILPERYQKQYRDERIARFILTGGVGFAMVVGVFAILLLPSFFYLYFQSNVLAEGNAQAEQRLQQALEFRKEIERVNALTSAAVGTGAQNEYTRALFTKIFGAAPKGITLDRVAYVRKDRMVTLTGVATTRTALKDYVDALSALEGILKAEAPTANYLASTNARFTISVTLK